MQRRMEPQAGMRVLCSVPCHDKRRVLGQDTHRKPGMEMITLTWNGDDQDIVMEISDDIATIDLLELLDIFIKTTNREPSGTLDYTSEEW